MQTEALHHPALNDLRLFLEEVCCALCRFEHVAQDGLAPECIRIDREVYLGVPGVFADIRVTLPGRAPYFVDVKFGYPAEMVLRQLRRKYTIETPAVLEASRVILVVDSEKHADWAHTEAELRSSLPAHLELEIWNEQRILSMLSARFGTDQKTITAETAASMRAAIEEAKRGYAFGGSPTDATNEAVQSSLLWHFDFWRLRQMREAGLAPREILSPGLYRGIVVLIADLCSFSSHVRDTEDDEVVRYSLTSFYSKARYQIHNAGGMMYMFVGDEVVALFGLPDHPADFVRDAMKTALAMIDIGNSVANEWQRHIDRVQQSGGVHIGMAMGNLQVLSLRPYSRTHMGVVGDIINVAARLNKAAGPSEIVVSNTLFREMPEDVQASFRKMDPVQGHNVGSIKSWKYVSPHAERASHGASGVTDTDLKG